MDRTERFYKIQRLLNQRRVVSIETFLEELEVSRATFKRDLEYLRDRFGMPIVWDRSRGGYLIDTSQPDADAWQLPGLWFSAGEIHALLTMERLLETLQPGLLSAQIRPLKERIRQLLEAGDHSPDELNRRIRVLQMGHRLVEPDHFQVIASALLSRRRLRISHYRREAGERLARTVSPQRLVHYRDNWYLDAWCHTRQALRTFSVDAIGEASIDSHVARDVPDEQLDAVLAAGFGIFSGERTETAVLRFNPKRARWVARETWHPNQEGDYELDGYYVLNVPYSDPRELVMDVLKYGPDVEVLGPQSLRDLVMKTLDAARTVYGDPSAPSPG